MKVFAQWDPAKSGGKKASKAKKRETVQASRAYTPQKGTFQRIREGVQRVASAAGNAIRRRLH